MWFAFGIITLISFSAYQYYRRLNAAWQGRNGSVAGISFQFMTTEQKYRAKRLSIGIEAPRGYDYSLKQETDSDRFFKFIGLSEELQTGDKEFDDLVYVASNNDNFYRQVKSNKVIRKAVIALLKGCDEIYCTTEEIRHNSGRLWIKLKAKDDFSEENFLENCATIVGHLKSLAQELEQLPEGAVSKWKDPFVVRAAIILAISSGLAINGAVHFVRQEFIKIPFTIDTGLVSSDAKTYGIILTCTLLITAILALHRSARTHFVLLEILLVGSFGSFASAYVVLNDVNRNFDYTDAKTFIVDAVSKHKTEGHGRRNTSKFYVTVKDWNNPNQNLDIHAPYALYKHVSVGDKLLISQKDGFLGYRWVESIVNQNYQKPPMEEFNWDWSLPE